MKLKRNLSIIDVLNTGIIRLSYIDKLIDSSIPNTSQVKTGQYNFQKKDITKINGFINYFFKHLNLLLDNIGQQTEFSDEKVQHRVFKFTAKFEESLKIKKVCAWTEYEYNQFMYYYRRHKGTNKKTPFEIRKKCSGSIIEKYLNGLKIHANNIYT